MKSAGLVTVGFILSIKKDGIRQLTVDHNQAQVLVDTGEISIEEARLHPSQRMVDACCRDQ